MTSRKTLTPDFNATAASYLNKEVSADLLLAKYGLQLGFASQSVEEKEKLVTALFDCALKYLDRRAAPDYYGYIGATDIDSVARLLTRLAAPDSAPLLPAQAAAKLAETGMKFVETAETTSDGIDRKVLTSMADLCLTHAEIFKDLIEKRNEDIRTSKVITPARRIVLKKDDTPPPGP